MSSDDIHRPSMGPHTRDPNENSTVGHSSHHLALFSNSAKRPECCSFEQNCFDGDNATVRFIHEPNYSIILPLFEHTIVSQSKK